MGKQGNEGISWTDFTFNPWWGCAKVSPGCQNCYAETLANRFGVSWGFNAIRKPASENVWAQPIKWNKAAQKVGKRAKVFCSSMADVFDDNSPEHSLPRLFDLMKTTPWLDWQVLTKRPENIKKNLPADWSKDGYRNVWLGVSVENQQMAEKRIPIILEIPATIRFLSCEPLLGPLSLRTIRGINWVIVGGESGHNARPMNESWATDIRDQCLDAGIAFFFKQWGEWRPYAAKDALEPVGQYIFQDGSASMHFGKAKNGSLLQGTDWKQFP